MTLVVDDVRVCLCACMYMKPHLVDASPWKVFAPVTNPHAARSSIALLTLASHGLPSPPVSYASSLEPHCVSGLPHHITAKRLKAESARPSESQFSPQARSTSPHSTSSMGAMESPPPFTPCSDGTALTGKSG
ncbi:hypothetical protein NQZ68_022140 [Dissostichus eleginoides]|nr:hypothetical protein NQZ68_022140 [Dissostichus eleginoides]